MKTIASILLLIIIPCQYIFSNHSIDSLENLYQNTNLEPSTQIEYIEKFLKHYYSKNPKKHFLYAKHLEKIARQTDNHTYLAKSFFEFGKYYKRKNILDSASYFLEKSIDKYQYLKDNQGIKTVQIQLSNLEKTKGNYTEAIIFLLKADSLNKIEYDEKAAISIQNNLGIIAQFQKSYTSALKYYKNILDITENEKYLAVAYTNISGVFINLNQQDSAKYYALKSLKLREKLGIKTGLTQIYNNLGAANVELKNFNEAKKWINKSLAEARAKNQIKTEITALNNLGNLEIELGNFKTAEKYLLESEKLLEKNSFLKQKTSNAKLFTKLYSKANEIENAYKYLKQYSNLKDSITAKENRELIQNFETKYNTEKFKQEKIIAESNETISNEKAKRSIYLSYSFGIFSIVIAFFLMFIFQKLKLIEKQNKELDIAYAQLEESKKNELAVSNLKTLQSQMNPHFIFNALNSVQDLVLLQDIRNSNKYLGKFSDLIRKILLSSKEQFITLEEEVEILSLYLDLEKLRFGDDFLIDLQCNISETKQNEIMLPTMFIQPYIENAIKHGLFHKQGIKKLKVYFNIKENGLECQIIDNGVGQEKAAELKIKRLHLHTGFSTEAINERIRLLNETLEKKIILITEDLYESGKAAGTKISLLFPF